MQANAAAELYLDLLKRCLTRSVFDDVQLVDLQPGDRLRSKVTTPVLDRLLRSRGLRAARVQRVDIERRRTGRDWPASAESMIGHLRLDNLQACATAAILDDVPGDFVETGVWRGGATILMRAVLQAYGDETRSVWACDSFEGLPPPDVASYPQDEGDRHSTLSHLAVSVEQVKRNFERYGLLDDRVRFLEGWFKDTLPTAPIEQISVLRLDGDMYESTIQAIEALYPKLSPGGFCIIDDYGELPGARAATDDYRAANGITEPIEPIDHSGVFWRRAHE